VNSSFENRLRIGSDICSVERIARVYGRYGIRFLNRILTEPEKKYVLSRQRQLAQTLAGRFAAKEAVAKALGTGWRGIYWNEVEILNAESGAPCVVLHERAAKRLVELGCHYAEISLSHEREYAFATALLY
jgi:holo-[acyl-carrier protein] synthase